MAKPITNDSTQKGKYNMDPEETTPYSQITLKPIILIVTAKYRARIQKPLVFKHHRITAATFATLGFEHRRSAHPEG
jgi:hypothetical protein